MPRGMRPTPPRHGPLLQAMGPLAAFALATGGLGGAASAEEPAETNATDPGGETGPRVIRYLLEGIVISGNDRTQTSVIRALLPVQAGDILDVDDPALEGIRWRLL
mgnify:CR=1 FL=1